MLLINGKPLDVNNPADLAAQWFKSESEKIRNRKEPVVIKRIPSTYRLDAQRRRRIPAPTAIPSRSILHSSRGLEEWICCETYRTDADHNISRSPHSYMFTHIHTFNPQIDHELIFYLTCVFDLNRAGYMIEDIELESHNINAQDIAELDVKYAIFRKFQEGDLKRIALSWGIMSAEKMGDEQLKRILFDTVKASEAKKQVTQRGYAEFLQEIMGEAEDLVNARVLVNKALEGKQLTYDKLDRTCKSGDQVVCRVPLSDINRYADFIAMRLLDKPTLYDTVEIDVYGPREEVKYSVADIEAMDDRAEMEKAARNMKYKLPPKIGDIKLKANLLERVRQE